MLIFFNNRSHANSILEVNKRKLNLNLVIEAVRSFVFGLQVLCWDLLGFVFEVQKEILSCIMDMNLSEKNEKNTFECSTLRSIYFNISLLFLLRSFCYFFLITLFLLITLLLITTLLLINNNAYFLTMLLF